MEQPVYISACVEGNPQTDGRVAREIIDTLKRNGCTCLGESVSIGAGLSELEVVRKDLGRCEFVVCVFSKEYLKDSLRWMELLIGLEKTTKAGSMKVVVVLMEDVDDVDIPNNPLLRKQSNRFIRIKDSADYGLKVLAQIKEEYSIKNILPAGNVAHGQAWSHFTGYLNLILPGLESKIRDSSWFKENPGRMSAKFFELVPLSAKCPKMIEGVGAESLGKIKVEGLMRGGTPRTYEVTVWSIKEQGEEYFFTGDYPAVVKAMYDFRDHMEGDLEWQVRRFDFALRRLSTIKTILNVTINTECFVMKSSLSSVKIELVKIPVALREKLAAIHLDISTSVCRGLMDLSFLFEKKITLGDQRKFDHDVSFLTGEDEGSVAFANKMYVDLKEDGRFKCNPRSQAIGSPDMEEMVKSKYTLLFLSKDDDDILTYRLCSLMTAKLQQRIVNIVPVLTDVDVSKIPSYLQWLTYVDIRKDKNALLERVKQFILGPDQQIDYALPVGDVYVGLVFGYYYNYLSFMLKAFKDSPIDNVAPRFYIVIPKSCVAHKDFSVVDERISLDEKRTIVKRTDAGEIDRKYETQIYKIEDSDQTYYFTGHYATPILALNEMMHGKIAGMSRLEMEDQRCKFVRLLKEKLSSSELKDNYCLIDYDDSTGLADRNISTNLAASSGSTDSKEPIATNLSDELLKDLRKNRNIC